MTENLIVTILKKTEEGIPAEYIRREHEISNSPFYKWRKMRQLKITWMMRTAVCRGKSQLADLTKWVY